MNRQDARRRKGSNRQQRGMSSITPQRRQWLEEARQESWGDGVADVIAYWKNTVPSPLFVYFIRELSKDDAVKIGKANDPGGRLVELQCGNPRYLKLEAVILASSSTERHLHTIWRDFALVRGEWFGDGYGDVILALAAETARRQIEAHRAGESGVAITEHLIKDIWPEKPRTKIADSWTEPDYEEVA